MCNTKKPKVDLIENSPCSTTVCNCEMCSIAYLFLLQDKRDGGRVKGQTGHKKTSADERFLYISKQYLIYHCWSFLIALVFKDEINDLNSTSNPR